MSRALQNYVVKSPAKDNMSKKTKQRLLFLCRLQSTKLSRDEIQEYKEELESLLEEEDINHSRFKGSPLLCVACRAGNLWAVDILLNQGADVNVSDKNKCTPVYIAASYGYEEIVKKLLAKKADVNHKNLQGYMPLISAVTNNHTETAKLLIEAGADVNIFRPNSIGMCLSLLAHVIFAKGDLELANILLEAGVNPHTFDRPLNIVFLAFGERYREMTKKLVYAGFNFYCDECLKWIEGARANLPESKEFVEFFERELHNPPSLERLCRTVVRCSLATSHIHCHIKHKVETLPLPISMKKYLLLQYN